MEKKKNWLKICMVVLLVSFLSGCSTTMSSSPFFYSNNSNYEFIILGEVTYESKTKYGFQELLKAARSKYPNCDYVIDVMVDSTIETTSYLLSFLFKTKTVVTYSMRGTAIQYIRRNTNGEIISTPTATTNQNSSNILSVKENNNTVTFPSSIIGIPNRPLHQNPLHLFMTIVLQALRPVPNRSFYQNALLFLPEMDTNTK